MADKLTLDRHAMKDRSTSHLRIYVGGLTDKATIEDLYEHFEPYGQINGIIVNRNFGFIQFQTEQSAHDAINKANGSTFQGRQINVKASQTNTDKPRFEPEAAAAVQKNPQPVENTPIVVPDDDVDDNYDSHGNYIGDSMGGNEEEHEDNYNQNWNESGGRGARGGRGRGRRARGRGGPPSFRERSPIRGRGPGEWPERGGYDRYQQKMPEYARPLPGPERNDCEIIVVSKALTEYAEFIEGRLKHLGIVVDLLFPMEDVAIGKVLGNIASRGCLYAILVMPENQEHRSLTLTMLHGLPQEHRNMPLEDALQLLNRNYQEVQRGGSSGREAMYALLGQLADGRTLTALQYDKVIEYLQERREHQVKLELGEPLVPTAPANKTQADLQQRILSILNDKKATPPAPVPPPSSQTPASAQNKLLNDPTVRKALDSILQKFT